ncbi:TrkH-domain-containing protein [Panus rudis PR-1116 ss-1]|nr:TrkH-domain-containing protein [Panus rudis PR-1116 ss-1]
MWPTTPTSQVMVRATSLRERIKHELNFFRVHLLFFLFVPLISAIIFWAVNGQFHISFVDSLFLCYSALTVTGLSTVNLSTTTPLQQAILFVLMCIGNVTVVAWVMVLIRKRYFKQRIIFEADKERFRSRMADRVLRFVHKRGHHALASVNPSVHNAPARNGSSGIQELDGGIGAALVAGGLDIGIGMGMGLGRDRSPVSETQQETPQWETVLEKAEPLPPLGLGNEVESPKSISRSLELPQTESNAIMVSSQSFTSSPRSGAAPLPTPASPTDPRSPGFVSFAGLFSPQSLRARPITRRQRTMILPPKIYDNTAEDLGLRPKDQGLGGFPGPIQLMERFVKHRFPSLYERVVNLASEPVWMQNPKKESKSIRKLKEDFEHLIIGRNSWFNTDELTDEELERLGGIEYRALRFLSYLVFFYFVGIQLISFILIAPWLSTTSAYDDVFNSQPRLVNKAWFSAFQVVAAYTGGGMSLVDAGMVPFQNAYLLIFSLIFAILAGNHGLPIFLRLSIWIATKFVEDGSEADETLHFLLDHPRRCFLYLFPSHVTWFLLATLIIFTTIEWASFVVLDLGLDVLKSLSPGTQAVAGLFQSFAVRASGFSIVSLASLAPSFQFLCIVMMYIAVYPVALSIRSTNVYEERSLGVFELPDEDEEEPELGEHGSRRERIGKYFGWHLRRQVAYDIWWLVWGIFVICIVERTKIMDDDNAPWFNLFRIIFELVSAFGGIGLTLGIPTENFSFSGAFGPISKLVVIVIMIRGRHRGLPVAIDRAILLPSDLVRKKDGDPTSATSAHQQNPGPDAHLSEKDSPPEINISRGTTDTHVEHTTTQETT